MNIAEIETYYGLEASRWIREKMADGTIKSLPAVIRWSNPRCLKPRLSIADMINLGLIGVCPMQYPDEVRSFDIVRVTE